MGCDDFTMWGSPEEMLEVDPNVFCGKDIEEETSKSPGSPTKPYGRYISSEELLIIKEKLNKRREICGIVIPGNEELVLEFRDRGPYINNGDRGSCKSTNVWINFHTHPYVTLPWPSTEDIFKVLENRKGPILWGSLIFCEWGIWEIYSSGKIDKKYLDKILQEWTTNTSDELFRDLDLRDFVENPGANGAIPELENVHKPVKSFLDKWGNGWEEYGLEITITDWKDVPGYYPLQTGLKNVPL